MYSVIIATGPGVSSMKYDFLGLEAFLSVAELGSFSRAAEHLNLTQTAITHRVRKLEGNMGVQLFIRSTRNVALAQAGVELLPVVRRLFAETEQHIEGIQRRTNTPRNRLTLACLPTIATSVLPLAIARFIERSPDMELHVMDVSATDIGPLVDAGEADFGLTIMAAGSQTRKAEALFTENYHLVCPSDHPLSSCTSVSWSDLQDVKLIRVNSQTANRFIVDQSLGHRRETLDWAYEVQHTLTAIRFVQAGIGLTVMPLTAVKSLVAEGLCALPVKKPSVSRTIGIVRHVNKPPSQIVTEFVKSLKIAIRQYGL